MKRASLAFFLSALPIALSTLARAAEPPAPATSADPFAPPPEGKPPATDDEEAALLAAPDKPAPPPASPPSPPPPPRRPVAGTGERQAHQFRDEERTGAGLAIELSTSGFASGALVGGLFVGGHIPTGMIIGGFLDYGLTSVTATPDSGAPTTLSQQIFRMGAGLRQPILRSADRRVDLYGAADAAFLYKSAESESTMAGMPTATGSAAGFSLALGPGLRLWVHEQIAIGYVARLRVSYLSGARGALATDPNDDPTDASLTEIRFDGAFQILGIF